MKKSKGFTVIELLLVFALIAILAVLLMVSLRGIRDKARDARIKGDLTQVRNIAETIYYEVTPSSFDTLCVGNTLNGGNPQLLNVREDIVDQGGDIECNSSGNEYCVSSELNLQKEGAANYFCIDALTQAKETVSDCLGLIKCPDN